MRDALTEMQLSAERFKWPSRFRVGAWEPVAPRRPRVWRQGRYSRWDEIDLSRAIEQLPPRRDGVEECRHGVGKKFGELSQWSRPGFDPDAWWLNQWRKGSKTKRRLRDVPPTPKKKYEDLRLKPKQESQPSTAHLQVTPLQWHTMPSAPQKMWTCYECSVHFIDEPSLATHFATHKRKPRTTEWSFTSDVGASAVGHGKGGVTCRTRRPEPVCTCGEYAIIWR